MRLIDLPDGLVAHYFGRHPERGRMIPGLNIKRHYTTEKNMFGRTKVVDVPIMVRPVVCLKHAAKGKWSLIVAPEYEAAALKWLETLKWSYTALHRPRKVVRKAGKPKIVKWDIWS